MAHTYHKLLFHVVFSTKHRQPLITPDWQPDLYAYIGGILRNRKTDLLAAGGMPDHIHLLLKHPAGAALADTVRDLKAVSSKWRHDAGHPAFAWQTGYGAFSVSQSMADTVSGYIGCQEDHHRGRSFQDEFTELLRRHAIEYDAQYLWD
ncbi:MAG: IS200/IS605 family transposase [Gemmataceae bacterium]